MFIVAHIIGTFNAVIMDFAQSYIPRVDFSFTQIHNLQFIGD